MLKTLKGRTALAAALLAGIGIAIVTSLQANLSERSVVASTVNQHETYTGRVAADIDARLRLARSSLSEFAANIPGDQLADPITLQRYLTSRVGLQQSFESIAVYGVDGQLMASRPSMPTISALGEDWFAAGLRKASTIGRPTRGRFNNEFVVPLTYRVYDEGGVLRGVAVGTLPTEQLLNAASRDEGKAHFIALDADGNVVLHPDPALIGRYAQSLGPESTPLLAGLAAPDGAVPGPDERGVRSLYVFRPVPAAGWLLAGVVSHEAAYASLARLSQQMLLAGSGLALLLIPAMWLLVGRMLRPIDELRREMQRLTHGGELGEQRVVRAATEELRQLAEAFADMAAARRVAEVALLQEKQRAEVTLQSIGDAVVATDGRGGIAAMNVAAEQLTGWALADALGRPFAEVVRISDEASGEPRPDLALEAMREGRIVGWPQALLTDRQAVSVPIDNSAAPIHSAGGAIDGAVIVFRNVAAARAAAKELNWRASHDAMTGLLNRAAYDQALDRLFESAQTGAEHSLIVFDLDQFKSVNDSAGHAAGDALLVQLAARFVLHARRSDMVARLGGDEFAVLMPQCASANALRLAELLRRGVADFRFDWEGQSFRVGASIGVVQMDRSFASAAAVQKAADMACYRAKRKGRNRVCLHVPGVPDSR